MIIVSELLRKYIIYAMEKIQTKLDQKPVVKHRFIRIAEFDNDWVMIESFIDAKFHRTR